MRIELWGNIIQTQNNTIQGYINDFSSELQNIKNQVASIGSYWSGDDYELYYKGMNDFISQVENFVKTLDGFHQYVDKYLDNAIEMLDAIDENNPEYERAMFYKSFILNASGIEDNSSEILQEFLSNFDESVDLNDLLEMDDEFDENNPEDLSIMGELYFDNKEYEEAIEYFNSSLKILPNQPDVLEFKALALCELKKYKKALKTINKAIELTPDDDTLWDTKGNIYYAQKNTKKR